MSTVNSIRADKYRPEIDGLRAVAVVPVIFFHAGFSWFRGGFVGVDVFFVISGFLITSIIVDDLRSERFSIARFYERRARRILPALFFLMLLCVPLAWAWMTASQLKLFAKSIVAVTFFSSNVLFAMTSGYFAPGVEDNPLIHTWSLGVEEQFYLLFPLLLAWTWRRGRKCALGSVVAVTLASLALAEYGVRHYPMINFFLSPPRAWELMIGAFLSLAVGDTPVSERIGQRVCDAMAGLGMLAIVAAVVCYNSATPFPSVFALLPTVGTALILGFCSSSTYVGRILANRLLVGIGLISYSAYLWHQPLFAFARIVTLGAVPTSVLLLLALVTFSMATLSWRYIEAPFRTRARFNPRQIFTMSAAGSACFLAFGFGRYIMDRDNHLSYWRRVNVGLSQRCDFDGPFQPLTQCATSGSPEMMVWGDSFAMHIVPGILASDSTAALVQATRSGCGPLLDIAPVARNDLSATTQSAASCRNFNHSVLTYLEHQPSIHTVILASVFVQYVDNAVTQLATGEGMIDASPEAAAAYMDRTIAALQKLGKRVVVVAPPPSGGFDMGACVERRRLRKPTWGPYSDCVINRKIYVQKNSRVLEFLSAMGPEVRLFRFDGALCHGDTCATTIKGIPIFRDGGHFSYDGIEYLGRQMSLLSTLERVAR